MNCKNCGAECNENAKFCMRCGAKLEGGTESVFSSAETVAQPAVVAPEQEPVPQAVYTTPIQEPIQRVIHTPPAQEPVVQSTYIPPMQAYAAPVSSYAPPATKRESNQVIGLVLIVLGALLAIGSVLLTVLTSLGVSPEDYVAAAGLIAFGVVLLQRKVKQWGWGVGAILGFAGILSSLYDESFLQACVCAVIAAVMLVLLLRANQKKEE